MINSLNLTSKLVIKFKNSRLNMRVLILGVTGMLGNAMFKTLSSEKLFNVFGTVRDASSIKHFPSELSASLISNTDADSHDSLIKAFLHAKPDVVINCIGLVKQLAVADDPLQAIPINTLLPNRLESLSELVGARFIHISTDCVFSGKKGNYLESDSPDAEDLYGRTKLLGEVSGRNAITLRTSIIGHELTGNRSLVNWFLSQEGSVTGFRKAIFSGLPTNELARIVRDIVIPKNDLSGLYHVSSGAINKFNLLTLIAEVYGKEIKIIPSDEFVIDRSLNSQLFTKDFGYVAPEWPELIEQMYKFNMEFSSYV